LLHELVVCLKVLEVCYGFQQLLVVYVSGKPMQGQGTDGVSHGQLLEGIMNGESMISFMLLHETAFDRSPQLKDWLKDLISCDLEFLTEDDWFEQGHNHFGKGKVHLDGYWHPTLWTGKFIWAPAPAAVWVASEELHKSRMK
jgi:hypothetical protein